MWRLVFPLILAIAAAYVYSEGHDGDGVFVLFPLTDRIPGVGEDMVARADASAAILALLAGLSAALQVGFAIRARRRGNGED